MLSLELCKKLKEAGFKQECTNGDLYYHFSDGYRWYPTVYSEDDWDDGAMEDMIKIPSLSELLKVSLNINSLGDGFESLNARSKDFYCKGYITGVGEITTEGSTPEEAVCNLYLSLHPKTTE